MKKGSKNKLFVPKSRWRREWRSIMRRMEKGHQFVFAITESDKALFYVVNQKMLDELHVDLAVIRDENSSAILGSIEGVLSGNSEQKGFLTSIPATDKCFLDHYFTPIFNQGDIVIPGFVLNRCNLSKDQGIEFSKFESGRVVMHPIRETITDQLLSQNPTWSRLFDLNGEYQNHPVMKACVEFWEEFLIRKANGSSPRGLNNMDKKEGD